MNRIKELVDNYKKTLEAHIESIEALKEIGLMAVGLNRELHVCYTTKEKAWENLTSSLGCKTKITERSSAEYLAEESARYEGMYIFRLLSGNESEVAE